jgi:hypothetical protein
MEVSRRVPGTKAPGMLQGVWCRGCANELSSELSSVGLMMAQLAALARRTGPSRNEGVALGADRERVNKAGILPGNFTADNAGTRGSVSSSCSAFASRSRCLPGATFRLRTRLRFGTPWRHTCGLPRGFRRKELSRWLAKIPSERSRTLTTQKLDARRVVDAMRARGGLESQGPPRPRCAQAPLARRPSPGQAAKQIRRAPRRRRPMVTHGHAVSLA